MNDNGRPSLTFNDAFEELRGLGVELLTCPAEYRVRIKKAPLEDAEYFEHLDDALDYGRELAKTVRPARAPFHWRTQRLIIAEKQLKIAAARRIRRY